MAVIESLPDHSPPIHLPRSARLTPLSAAEYSLLALSTSTSSPHLAVPPTPPPTHPSPAPSHSSSASSLPSPILAAAFAGSPARRELIIGSPLLSPRALRPASSPRTRPAQSPIFATPSSRPGRTPSSHTLQWFSSSPGLSSFLLPPPTAPLTPPSSSSLDLLQHRPPSASSLSMSLSIDATFPPPQRSRAADRATRRRQRRREMLQEVAGDIGGSVWPPVGLNVDDAEVGPADLERGVFGAQAQVQDDVSVADPADALADLLAAVELSRRQKSPSPARRAVATRRRGTHTREDVSGAETGGGASSAGRLNRRERRHREQRVSEEREEHEQERDPDAGMFTMDDLDLDHGGSSFSAAPVPGSPPSPSPAFNSPCRPRPVPSPGRASSSNPTASADGPSDPPPLPKRARRKGGKRNRNAAESDLEEGTGDGNRTLSTNDQSNEASPSSRRGSSSRSGKHKSDGSGRPSEGSAETGWEAGGPGDGKGKGKGKGRKGRRGDTAVRNLALSISIVLAVMVEALVLQASVPSEGPLKRACLWVPVVFIMLNNVVYGIIAFDLILAFTVSVLAYWRLNNILIMGNAEHLITAKRRFAAEVSIYALTAIIILVCGLAGAFDLSSGGLPSTSSISAQRNGFQGRED
ncbi:hypothetical protein M427DRAFT_68695 [Gonapodya prolifera JEL478]|uniref:Uncharacterized protein n=1 Tax=Gonapodya prolifera (strain JEL478) TaxID=1344416 RepID=A0A139AJE4_GONPJ|nr:hypothetical protein M427DRAFT_68695 [Gonapodya prolifera JEL478]|eukprot:KXS16926.1 hypothetical protein M427DRAFT_68695 [Gonapodya prolifera JEL478]